MVDAAPPRIFISYSHDSDEHRDRVLDLADRVRADGIDAIIDQYIQSPPEGWPGWCKTELEQAGFVLMVCTETYLRRVDRKAEPGVGHGVLWEGRLINQYLYDAGSVSTKFVPVLLSDGSPEHIPTPVKGGTIYRLGTSGGYEALLRLVTEQPLTPMPPLGRRRSLAPKQRRSGGARDEPSKLAASLPHPRVEDLFVGRQPERVALAAALFPTSGTRRPVVVSGMAGVGKSYLVDRFFWESAAQFPGGYVRLALDPDNPVNAAEVLANLRDRLKLPASDDAALAARLLMPLTLVHIENADTFEAGQVAGDLAAPLPGCPLVVSARYRGLGLGAGWRDVEIAPFDTAAALEQLRAELGPEAPGQDGWPALAVALGCLPLALHLSAGHLRADHRADAFLRRLRAKNLALTGTDPADPTFRQRSRSLLSDTFELSLDALRRDGQADGERWLVALSALGHAPAAGFGESLGAAISGLPPQAFDEMALSAARLSLLDRVAREAGSAFRLHPLLAELVRPRADKDTIFARVTEWFLARLPEGGEDQGHRWRETHDEIAALTEWLAQVPPADRMGVARAGSRYARTNGPYYAWLRLCEVALAGELNDDERSNLLWTLANVARRGGLPDRGLTAAKEKRDLDLRRGEVREAALAAGLVASILETRGDLDDALRIRAQEELPVFERLGDMRGAALAKGQIADILQARGDLDSALRIQQEEVLPIFERLNGARETAVTKGKIADILQARGDHNGALCIQQEEVLPVFERLGDVRSAAVTKEKIADILQGLGEHDRALQMREEVLPVYEHLGDVRKLALTKGKMADILQMRGDLEGALFLHRNEVLPVFERLGEVRQIAVEKGRIADILQARGDLDGALSLREEELSVYERLADAGALVIGRESIAMTLLRRGHEDDRDEARRLLGIALDDARRLKLRAAQRIERTIDQAGLGGG